MGGAAKAVTNFSKNPIKGVFGGSGGDLGRLMGKTNPFNGNFLGMGGNAGRAFQGVTTGGLSEFTRKNPFGAPINNPLAEDGSSNSPAISGPFSLDQDQFDADREAINAEGQKQYGAATDLGKSQYDQLLSGIDTNSAAQTQRAKDLFGQMLPNIAENSQAAHLYDSSGYGQEVGRQQGNIASQVASDAAQQKLAALQGLQGNQSSSLQGLQGFQTGALQRGLSMEDFINQANVAKTIGAQMAPQMPSGKATGLSGGVAGASAGAPFGPAGAGIGGLAGLIMGSNVNKRGK